MTLRVLIAGDNLLVREGIETLFLAACTAEGRARAV